MEIKKTEDTQHAVGHWLTKYVQLLLKHLPASYTIRKKAVERLSAGISSKSQEKEMRMAKVH